MIKITNGKPESDTKVTLTLAGWVTVLTIVISIAGSFFTIQQRVARANEDIDKLQNTKLDTYRYERDCQIHNLRDSLVESKLDKIIEIIEK